MSTPSVLSGLAYLMILVGAYVGYRGHVAMNWKIVKKGIIIAVFGAFLLFFLILYRLLVV